MCPRKATFLAALGVLLVCGITCQWLAKDSAQLDEAAARIADVPRVVGAWTAHDESVDEQAFEQAGAKGYWMRSYVHQRTKESIQVILMCGRPGKMAVHTPEVCYRGAGYEMRDQPSACAIKSERGEMQAELWTAQFRKKAVMPTQLRLYWGWSSSGVWAASQAPRWQFQGQPYLYKLYVSRDNSQQPSLAPQADPAAEFLREFVPVMNGTLFPEVVN